MKCSSCGASNSAEQSASGNCAYCNASLPHVDKAIAQEEAVRRLLEDRDGDGLPDGIQAISALQEAHTRKAEQDQLSAARQAKLKRLQARRALAEKAHAGLKSAAITAAVLAFFVSFPYHLIAVRWLELGPWFGVQHRILCPLVCEGCSGPYVIFGWKAYSSPTGSSGESTRAYCQPSPGHFNGYAESDFLGGLGANGRYELPGSTYLLWFTTIPLLLLLLLPVGYLIGALTVRRLRAGLPVLEEEIRALEAELEAD